MSDVQEVQETENDKVEPTEPSVVVLEAEEIGESEIEKLKGDTVGNTVYSGKWIINTLLSISKVKLLRPLLGLDRRKPCV